MFESNREDVEIRKVLEEAKDKIENSEWIFLIADKLGDTYSKNKEIEKLFSGCRDILWIGIGGSSSGPRAIFRIIPRENRFPEVSFFESPEDKEELHERLEDKRKKVVYVVSKSGETFETMELMRQVDLKIKKGGKKVKVLAVTQKDTPLYRKVKRYNGSILEFPSFLSGRFSTFFISWLPMKICGINTGKITRTTERIRRNFLSPKSLHFEIAKFLLANEKNDIFLCFYSRNLYELGENITQLIGESIGKDGNGPTPIAVLGPHFQHSVAQLILGNPKSKSAIFINPPKTKKYKEVLIESKVTADVFREKIPVLEINLENEKEDGITELLFSFQIGIAVAGKIMGVNPFNQPEVAKIRDLLIHTNT
jgi:glucose-6-phosphate isomerase